MVPGALLSRLPSQRDISPAKGKETPGISGWKGRYDRVRTLMLRCSAAAAAAEASSSSRSSSISSSRSSSDNNSSSSSSSRRAGIVGWPQALALPTAYTLVHPQSTSGSCLQPLSLPGDLPEPGLRLLANAFFIYRELSRRAMNRELLMGSMLVVGKHSACSQAYASSDGSIEVNAKIQLMPCSRRHFSSLSRRRA